MARAETVLLKSTLEVDGKHFTVKLTTEELYWEVFLSDRVTSGPYAEPLVRAENQSISLKDVIAVKPLKDYLQKQSFRPKSLELQALNPTAFTLWVVKRHTGFKWRKHEFTFSSSDTHVTNQWIDKIHEIMRQPELRRPSSLLVFVNPVSGVKAGVKIFQHKVAPLLDLAGIEYNMVITQRVNHARDMLMEHDLKKIDGVVSVGGDGMFTEILHGLMYRTNKENGVQLTDPSVRPARPRIRLGIIPAGSTDTVIWSLQGCNDPVTSTLHIIVGDELHMDIATIHQGNRFIRYNTSLLGYGYYGDCIVDSENYRMLGPRRYDFAGFKALLQNKSYEGELSYLPSTDKDNHPRDRTTCRAGCTVCATLSDEKPDSEKELDITSPESPKSTVSVGQGWRQVSGSFAAINNFLISCRCRFSELGPVPACHIGDGCADLVIVKECSRTSYFRHLYRCMKPNKDQFDFPFIKVARVTEFKFRPAESFLDDSHESLASSGQRLRSRGGQTSVWNCDGEVLADATLHYKVHRQVIPLFARAPEEPIYEEPSCCSCCCPKPLVQSSYMIRV